MFVDMYMRMCVADCYAVAAEQEVVNGKGQFSCGNKTCPEAEGLRTWEVNFAYREQEEKKNALVKLRK